MDPGAGGGQGKPSNAEQECPLDIATFMHSGLSKLHHPGECQKLAMSDGRPVRQSFHGLIRWKIFVVHVQVAMWGALKDSCRCKYFCSELPAMMLNEIHTLATTKSASADDGALLISPAASSLKQTDSCIVVL